MPNDPSTAARDPGQFRKDLRQTSLKIIREHARKMKGEAWESWRQVLDEIQHLYCYDAWDLLFVLAFTLALHPKTGITGTFRQEAAELKRRRQKATRELERFHARWMMGENPLFESLEVREAPHPAYDLVETRGRPANWALDEFSGHLGVILIDTRWSQARPVSADADPYDFVFSYGKDLLKFAGGIHVRPKALYDRYWRLKQEGTLPPPPNNEDPLTWIEAIGERIVGRAGATDRAIFLLSVADLPEERMRLRLRANLKQVEVMSMLAERGDLESLRRALTPPKTRK